MLLPAVPRLVDGHGLVVDVVDDAGLAVVEVLAASAVVLLRGDLLLLVARVVRGVPVEAVFAVLAGLAVIRGVGAGLAAAAVGGAAVARSAAMSGNGNKLKELSGLGNENQCTVLRYVRANDDGVIAITQLLLGGIKLFLEC